MDNSSIPVMATLSGGKVEGGGEYVAYDPSQKDSAFANECNGVASNDAYYPSAFVPAGGSRRSHIPCAPVCLGSSSASAFTPLAQLRRVSGTNGLAPSTSAGSLALPFAPVLPGLGSANAPAAVIKISNDAVVACVVKQELASTDSEDNGLLPCKSNTADLQSSDNSCSTGSPVDESRNLRQKRKRNLLHDSQIACPVCGVTLRPAEINAHFMLELDRLDKLHKHSGKRSSSAITCGSGLRSTQTVPSPPTHDEAIARNESFQQVRRNRLARQAQGKGKSKLKRDEPVCPVCSTKLPLGTTQDELSEHVELCLKKEENSKDCPVDSEVYEEYQWAGETRVRATTMLPGGSLASCGFQVASRSQAGSNDDDEDLVVDGDDGEDQYGAREYGEADVILCASEHPEEDKEREALRGAFLSGSQSTATSCTRSPGTSSKWLPSDESAAGAAGKSDEVDHAQDECFKCLICMDRYTKPLVSVQCWHVLCEECWLRALGAKKLCPQCNMITSPSHLRRIYL